MSHVASASLIAPHALLPHGWARDVLMTWDETGTLTGVSPGASASSNVPRVAGALVPGMPNLHSHAFQRAFAGLSEYRTAGANQASNQADSFWTWRELMYRFAMNLGPDELEAIATHLYVEMLQAGYTSVCEFHYLHHDPTGQRYADPAEMSLRLMSAARRAGIGMTLLPVLYQHAGFGGLPARADQRRFINSVDSLLDIVDRARLNRPREGARSSVPNATVGDVRIGVAPHSIRAVGPDALRELVSSIHAIDPGAPVHIHIAEQQQEVLDCVAWSGQRPVEWLLATADVDARWCLVHATHMVDAERRSAAATGCVAGLCPSTEANLGDGVFDASGYQRDSGTWGIGSDSHASVSASEELRLLEYTQRLAQRRRNVLASDAHPQVADHLWLAAVRGGARASGRAIGGIAIGEQADFAALSIRGPLEGLSPAQVLSSQLFANHGHNAVSDVWVGGRHRVQDGEHALQGTACEQFVAARRRLLSAL